MTLSSRNLLPGGAALLICSASIALGLRLDWAGIYAGAEIIAETPTGDDSIPPHARGGPPSDHGSTPMLVVPPCGCLDDAPQINAALATGSPVSLLDGATYTIASPILPPSGAELHLAGATLDSAVLDAGACSTWAATICAGYTHGTPTRLAVPGVAGSSTLSLTSNAGLVVGGYVHILPMTVEPEFSQTFKIGSIAGDGPYTVTIADGRSLTWAYPVETTNVIAGPGMPSEIHVHGEGAVINVRTLAQQRGVQLQGCQHCTLTDLTITGMPLIGMSYDLGGYRNVVRGLVVDARAPVVSGASAGAGGRVRLTVDSTSGLVGGPFVTVEGIAGTGGLAAAANGAFQLAIVDATHVELVGSTFTGGYASGGRILATMEGVMSEGCESCRYEDIKIRGAGLGLAPFASTSSEYRGIDVGAPCFLGIVLDDNGIYGSVGSTLSDPVVSGCAAQGISVLDASTGWTIRGGRVSRSGADGIRVATDMGGAPDSLLIEGTMVVASNNGVHMANATSATLRGLSLLSNKNVGVWLDAGAGSVTVADSVMSNNNMGVYVSGGAAATTIKLSGLAISGGSYGVEGLGGPYTVIARNTKVSHSGAGPRYGFWFGNTGAWDLDGVTVDLTTTTGSASWLVAYASAGSSGSVTCKGCFATGSGYGMVSFRAGQVISWDSSTDLSGMMTYPTPEPGAGATMSLR